MTHRNAPLTPEGRKRLCQRIDSGRPIAHVAAEAGVSRATLSKWYGRWTEDGDEGLMDRTSRPESSPNAISDDIVDAILELRRQKKWGKARIAAHLNEKGIKVSDATVQRTLQRHQISRVVNMDPPTGESSRQVIRYEHGAAGDMIHVDVKKVGKIPTGGGWRIHGQGSEEHKASKRKGQGTGRIGVDYLHSAVDDYSRIAYTEVLANEKGPTAAAFWLRAADFFAEHGIHHIERCLTDNGSCYRSRAWAEALEATGTRHKRTRPYTPRTNGKVERYNKTMSTEWLYVRAYTSNAERTAALVDFLNYYNYERNHSSLGWRPPMSRAPASSGALLESVPIDLEAPEVTDEQLTIFDL